MLAHHRLLLHDKMQQLFNGRHPARLLGQLWIAGEDLSCSALGRKVVLHLLSLQIRLHHDCNADLIVCRCSLSRHLFLPLHGL